MIRLLASFMCFYAVACFAAQLDPTLDELGDIKTAVSEAVTNCIIHGYENMYLPLGILWLSVLFL